jgi:chemotaxis protein histidine kinase CheA
MAASEASGGSGGFQARKARLRAAFLDHLPARLDEARALLADLTGPTLDAAQLEPMRLVMHTIKGSAGSFGLADIAEQASHADAAIKAHEPAMDADALIRLLAERIEALSQLATAAPAAAASTGFELPSATRTTGPATPPADADVASAAWMRMPRRHPRVDQPKRHRRSAMGTWSTCATTTPRWRN